MLTQTQLKSQIYTAITNNATIMAYLNAFTWLVNPVGQTIPFMTYVILSNPGGYVFGLTSDFDSPTFQFTLYSGGGGETVNLDPIIDEIKSEMHTLDYRLIDQQELFDSDVESVATVLRWERHNV